jgi:hypothetical protein
LTYKPATEKLQALAHGNHKIHNLNFTHRPDDQVLRLLAEKKHRSLTNMVEVMIRDCCKLHKVTLPEQQTLFDNENQLR